MTSHLSSLIDQWKDRRVLVVGDVMLDSYVVLKQAGACPEADAPIWKQINRVTFPGGAANAAVNLAALGASPILIGAVGADGEAGELDAMLGRLKIDSRLIVSRSQPTTTKSRLYGGGHMIARIDNDQEGLTEEEERALASEIRNVIHLFRPDGLLLSDYSKGVLRAEGETVAILGDLIDMVPHSLLDPRRSVLGGRVAIDAVTPNEREAVAIGGKNRQRFFAAIPDLKAVVETRGAKGAVIRKVDGNVAICPVRGRIADPNVCGAGDTFAAALLLARMAGADYLDATRVANFAASIVVREAGTAFVRAPELRRELDL